MKKYLLFILVLCNNFCFFAQNEEHGLDENVVDACLFKSALDYFADQDSAQYIPDSMNVSDFVPYQNNIYNNGGICYQRIGRFSDEDYFDEECVNDLMAAAPDAVKKIIINLLYPPKNKAALPKRLLLVGKPGTGKTTLAKAIALKCGYDYYLVEAPFLLNEYKNSGPQNLLREIYPLLESGRKVVVILDELTELTDRYKKENDSDATVAAALWILLDSCAQYENVFFIGTSNKEKKDLPAQLKSRFDEDIITIHMPDAAARKRMLHYYLKDERHKIDASFLHYLVKKTNGRSAREIEKMVCKAIQFANVRTPRRYTVTCKDFQRALALWKPFYHPAVVYEKCESHVQPFFKTAFPIILQTISLIHSIYVSAWQQKNSDESLALQGLSYLLQKIGLEYQKEGLDVQKNSFEFQKKAHQESYALQKDQAKWQKISTVVGVARLPVGG
jgi:AAA+ superfamily predicted ATPase